MPIVTRPLISIIFITLMLVLIPGFNQIASAQNVPTWELYNIDGGRDLLAEALDSVGFTRDDLGYRPVGYWTRFPRVPYKLPIFDSLFSEPMRVYDYTMGMGSVIEQCLTPDRTSTHRPDGIISNNSIHKIFVLTAVEARVDGFRSYSTNLLPQVDDEEPILDAIRNLYTADQEMLLRPSFGAIPAWPNPENDINSQLEGVDIGLQKIFAELILNALDAQMWRDEALRLVPGDLRNSVFYIEDFAQTQGDGIVYFPQVDDVKRLIDEQSMAYAAMKLAQATEDARWVLDAYFAEHPDQRNFNFEIMTPFGRIEISGSGNDVHDDGDYFILVDLGGDDLYQGSVGATSRPDIGISTALDLEGNDRYECDQNIPTQGAGVLGCGILYDAKGDDVYIAKDMAQGAGFFGTGIIYDGDGADEYQMEETGQGSGNFGHGLALDSGDGNDSYRMWGEGQGFGGCNGIGILANWSGDEHYYAEPYASVVNRGDYHSAFALNVSNCQGVGSGRRGDGTDGHSYAGGLGLIADYHGNDKYEAGNFSIGCGYWFGIGLVYDKEGDDTYYSPVYTQASGVHYAIGAIIDEAGNDVHDTWDNSTSALSFARDFAISMLVDKAGDDYYRAYNTSLCYVNIRSNAFFFELGGNDHYVVGSPQQMLGACDFSDYNTPSAINPFAQYCNSFSLFMDTGGDDIYESWTREEVPSTETADQSTGTIPQPPQFIDHYVPSEIYGNNMRWEFPIPGTETYGYNNFGIGWDLEAGGASNPEFNGSVIDMTWLDPRPEPEAGEGE